MRNRFHSLCPYFAMFPETFAETWIEGLTEPGDLVLDPCCGRGTAPFQALLMDRRAIGNDINPVAYCVSRAKTNAPGPAALRRRLTLLEGAFRTGDWSERRSALPAFFHSAYTPGTLDQILYLRDRLAWRRSSVDCMLAALVLGVVHGESQKSGSYLSNQMPRTISTKPAYSLRYWEAHALKPPERDVFDVLRRQIDFRYASEPPGSSAEIYGEDFRELPRLLMPQRRQVRLALTSPPYLDVTNFEEDQWLRLWFLGGPGRPTYRRVSKDDRHEHPSSYWKLIADLWRVLGSLVADGGHVVLRIGGRKLSPEQIVKGLEASSLFSGRRVELRSSETSPIRGRQTRSFRPGSTGCGLEVDCHFQVH